jgi:hypothetical protein
MPIENLERVRAREGRLGKRLKERGASLDGPGKRRLEKQLRRVQRKRRRLSGAGVKPAEPPKAAG